MKGNATVGVVLPDTIEKANYAAVLPCSNSFFNVRKNRKWGYLDAMGNIITPCKYDGPSDFENGHAMVRRDREFFYVNEQGEERAI